MHKRWIQAIFLCHQLRQIFLLFHSADFGPSPGEARGSARLDTGSPPGAPCSRAAPPPPLQGDLCAYSLAHVPSACCSSRRAARPRAHTCRSPPSSLARAEPRLTPAALTGEAGTGRGPPPATTHWWRCQERRDAREGFGLSLDYAARRVALLAGGRCRGEGSSEGANAFFLQPSLPWLLGMPSSVEPSVLSAEVRRVERAGKALVKQKGSGPKRWKRWE